jgi:hypothetical protein
MGKFRENEEFKTRFESMDVEELRRWKVYWTQHARHLQPNIRKEAMKRVVEIDRAIHQRLSDQED